MIPSRGKNTYSYLFLPVAFSKNANLKPFFQNFLFIFSSLKQVFILSENNCKFSVIKKKTIHKLYDSSFDHIYMRCIKRIRLRNKKSHEY